MTNTKPRKLLRWVQIVGIIAISTLIISCSNATSARTPTPTPTSISSGRASGSSQLKDFVYGFDIESDAEIANAAYDGVQGTLVYGNFPNGTDALSQSLSAHHMKAIDDMPWEYLFDYETKSGGITSTGALMNAITTHLEAVKNDPLITGYWVLDDWPYGSGTAKTLLQQITALIHQYTPGKRAICGFGGEMPPFPETRAGWDNATAANFSPQGCDMVGLYIYAQSRTKGTYDWSMRNTLPAVFSSLKRQGWDPKKEPIVGIPQTFGGDVEGVQWPIPTASDIETQTKAYCQAGATGIIFYDWATGYDNPFTDTDMAKGVKNGVADCDALWKISSSSLHLSQKFGFVVPL